MSAGLPVAAAEPGDAPALAALQLASWRAAYGPLLGEALFDGMPVEDRAEAWDRILGGTWAPGAVTRVVRAGGELLGFCTAVAPSRDADAGPRTAEVAALYVHPERWRGGAGAALLAATLAAFEDFDDVTLWVYEANARARAFYARHGFVPDGGEQLPPPPWDRLLVRMRRPL